MRRDPIVIVDYDPRWPALFERERAKIEVVIGDLLARAVEHIGSTAVPNLAAKPIVDMCAIVRDIDDLAAQEGRLESIGWLAAPEPSDVQDRRRSYCTPSVARRTHHLHVVEATSSAWRGWLAFRDHLRAHPDDASAYADLKRSLAADSPDPNDRTGYRAGKSGFIHELARLAIEAK